MISKHRFFQIIQRQFFSFSLINNPAQISIKHLLQPLKINQSIPLKTLSNFINVPEIDILQSLKDAKQLVKQGLESASIQKKDAQIVLLENGFKILNDSPQLSPKKPVICIMGHVDHGKTTLLDALRDSQIAQNEFGGITQKIGAFMLPGFCVIDTPGHEAFKNMRSRPAQICDIIVLVVSAVDGIQPQTLEVIELAKAYKVPLIVAINKIDVPSANPLEIEEELIQKGQLGLEGHGGNIPVIHISAKTKQNVDLLQELIMFQAELLDLKADFNSQGEAYILESRQSNDGESKSLTVIVQQGIIKATDWVVAGRECFKIKYMKNDRGVIVNKAEPGHAVEITGIKGEVKPGECLFVCDEQIGKLISMRRKAKKQQKEWSEDITISGENCKIKIANRREKGQVYSGKKEALISKFEEKKDQLKFQIEEIKKNIENNETDKKMTERQLKENKEKIIKFTQELKEIDHYIQNVILEQANNPNEFRIILKCPDESTLESLCKLIQDFDTQSKIKIVDSKVGPITAKDVENAQILDSSIYSLSVECQQEAQKQSLKHNVKLIQHKIIYHLVDELKELIEEKKQTVEKTGSATVLNIFEIKVNKKASKFVYGLIVRQGKINKKMKYRVVRLDQIIFDNLEIANLKKVKQETSSVEKGEECGLSFVQDVEIKVGDIIEAYQVA